MSFDLILFDAQSAPADRDGFLQWCEEQTEWRGQQDDNDINACMANCRHGIEMTLRHPAMHDPKTVEDLHNRKATDYGIGRYMIYAEFPWSQAGPRAATASNWQRSMASGIGKLS